MWPFDGAQERRHNPVANVARAPRGRRVTALLAIDQESLLKPAPFKYHDPRSLAEATGLLASLENARVLAGGQSLMPMMNFRYAMPDHVVDLNKAGELSFIRVGRESVRIGAMTRQRDLEFSSEVRDHCAVLQEALSHVGHRQTRNRGTIGGSLCHLDPSAELVNIAALLDGTFHVSSHKGSRDLPLSEFAASYMTSALEADELLSAVSLRLPRKSAGHAFVEFSRRHGDFAIVACSALLTLDRDGAIAEATLAISGLAHCPVRPDAIEAALIGEKPEATAFKAAAAEAGALEAASDAYVTAEYRRHLARILTYRALDKAASRAMELAHV
jgi:carbon-monoxide dehydrogenase medium subunit